MKTRKAKTAPLNAGLIALALTATGLLFEAPAAHAFPDPLLDKELNGGDAAAIEFKSMANQIGAYLKSHSELLPQIDRNVFDATVLIAHVRSTEEKVFDYLGVEKDVVGNASTLSIDINQERWSKLESTLKHPLVAHEILCLMGLEKSDDYTLSSQLPDITSPKSTATESPDEAFYTWVKSNQSKGANNTLVLPTREIHTFKRNGFLPRVVIRKIVMTAFRILSAESKRSFSDSEETLISEGIAPRWGNENWQTTTGAGALLDLIDGSLRASRKTLNEGPTLCFGITVDVGYPEMMKNWSLKAVIDWVDDTQMLMRLTDACISSPRENFNWMPMR